MAKEAFTRHGANASLDDIAKQVGLDLEPCIATSRRARNFYRRFIGPNWKSWPRPNRSCLETMAPIDALRAWLLLFVDAIAAKQLIAPALNTLLGDPKKVFEASYAKMHQAIRALVKRGVKSGDIRSDLDPVDLLRALIGVSNVASAPDWQPSARRLVDILIVGSQAIK